MKHTLDKQEARLDSENKGHGHAIKCSCGEWIEVEAMPDMTPGEAMTYAHEMFSSHVAKDD
jgi:hypothetical protein